MGSRNLQRLSFNALPELVELEEPDARSLLEEGVDAVEVRYPSSAPRC